LRFIVSLRFIDYEAVGCQFQSGVRNIQLFLFPATERG
jgi:hypothetical protein